MSVRLITAARKQRCINNPEAHGTKLRASSRNNSSNAALFSRWFRGDAAVFSACALSLSAVICGAAHAQTATSPERDAQRAVGAKPEAESTAVRSKTQSPAGSGELSASDRAVLKELLSQAGAANATLRSIERTPERQVAVMLRLAQEDLSKAKAMYCAAGDRVLDRFDAKATPEKNQAVMLEALVAVLPEAREVGCLNHIRNNDVLSVDIKLEDVPEPQRANFVKAAEAAVSAGKVARFLAPPREPDAFHFEFKRASE